ncbi:MAG: YihY/virulence factor BrkB family protein [Acidimicrobiales bacterium]
MALLRSLLAHVDAIQRRHAWLAFPVAVVRKTSNDQGGSLAALIAYYGFLSMFPLLLLFAASLGFVLAGDPALKAHVLHTTERSFPVASNYVTAVVSGDGAAFGVGLVGALWAGLGVARATERAMNSVWDIPMAERPNLWWSRLRALAMLGVLGAAFLVSSALAALQQVHGVLDVPSRVLGTVGPLALNFGLYLLAFQVLTNRHLEWRKVVPGAAVGAVGWTVLQSVGVYYTQHEVSHASQLYGSLAAVIGLIAWLYLGAQLTIYSAQVNVVHTYRLWPRSLVRGMHTDADRRALARQVAEAQRTADEVITVHFATAHPGTAATGDEAPSAPRADGGGDAADVIPTGEAAAVASADAVVPPEDLSPRALATHVAVDALIGHLRAYDALRQAIESGKERATEELVSRLHVESAGIATALSRLADREGEVARALHEKVA